MDFNDFQRECRKTAIYQERLNTLIGRLSYTTLGLTSEAGEVAGKLKKIMRDQNCYVSAESAEAIVSEIGDVLWYCTMICEELNFNVAECAEMVVNKLKSRQDRGVLGGSGDNR